MSSIGDEQNIDMREALQMALYVEDRILRRPIRKLSGGWVYRERIVGGDNMQMFVFARRGYGGMEYALVNKGTDFTVLSDYWNDIAQLFGRSYDMAASIRCARAFVRHNGDAGISFIGHSKGGAEAAANAIMTNRNAILFNPLRLSQTRELCECLPGYRGAVDVYAVINDPLKMLLGWTQGIPGTYSLLPSLTSTPHRLSAIECGITKAGTMSGGLRNAVI